jgi:agmatine/peptidylarginine deiminase
MQPLQIGKPYLPAEWHSQSFVQLTWPDATTDWKEILDETLVCFCQMAREIARRERLLIVCARPDDVERMLKLHLQDDWRNVTLVPCPINDTWARDHAFITLLDAAGQPIALDYAFNGWGRKFAADLDNQINARIIGDIRRLYGCDVAYDSQLDFILEGGSIESDGQGTLLTTSSCLLAPHRNEPMTRADIEHRLLNDLHAERVLWLEHGQLEGDDTDGHIDTLARFCTPDTIAYVQCTDETDSHFHDLRAMEQQLQTFRTATGQPYQLIPLPMPAPIHDESGERLPATYANFLIMNGAVLYPTYGQPENDLRAAQQLAAAFPQHEIVGIDCRVLIRQHGSLHCCTMQYPEKGAEA